MGKYKNYNNLYTCDWNQASYAPDLEDYQISAVLTIGKTTFPQMSMDFYTELGIQHYTVSIADLKDGVLEEAGVKIAKIINHFVSKNHHVLIRSNEDSGIPFAMIFYSVWIHYHNNNGTKKEGVKKPEISEASRVARELEKHHIATGIEQTLVQSLYKFENKYAGV